MNTNNRTTTISGRLMSIDALRGFDMFWIIGGGAIFSSLAKMWNNPVTEMIQRQLSHVEWEGFHFEDLIFPLFLFIVGAVLPFSISRRAERGQKRGRLYLHIVKRMVVLILLGFIMNGLLRFDWPNMRFAGVLQMIGLSYFFAAIIMLNTSVRMQTIITAGLLLGYWAALALIGAQMTRNGIVVCFGAGDYTIQGNLVSFLDQMFLPGTRYYGPTDGAGPFLTIAGTANVLLGVLAGHWLRSSLSQKRKVVGLVAAGLACLVIGSLWGQVFPIIKKIWISSFVLFTGGWSLLLLALFYWVIDVKGYKKWAIFFVVIGMNPITIYFLQSFVNFKGVADFFVQGFAEHAGLMEPLILTFGVLMVKWLFLWFLYRHRIFFKL